MTKPKQPIWPLASLYAFVFVFCAMLVIIPASCGGTNCKDPQNGSSAACTAETAAIDCGGGSIQGAITLWGPDIIKGFEDLRGPNGIDEAALETLLIQDIYKYGSCVAGAVFEQYFSPTATVVASAGSGSAGSGSAVTTVPNLAPRTALSAKDIATAKTAFEHARAKAIGGRKLKYDGGAL
jgi:hypothetical protein